MCSRSKIIYTGNNLNCNVNLSFMPSNSHYLPANKQYDCWDNQQDAISLMSLLIFVDSCINIGVLMKILLLL